MFSYLLSVLEYNIDQPEQQADFFHTFAESDFALANNKPGFYLLGRGELPTKRLSFPPKVFPEKN